MPDANDGTANVDSSIGAGNEVDAAAARAPVKNQLIGSNMNMRLGDIFAIDIDVPSAFARSRASDATIHDVC